MIKGAIRAMRDFADKLLHFTSGEFFLRKRPNGGTAILIRSLWVTAFLYPVAVIFKGLLATGFGPSVDWQRLRTTINDTIPWMGGIFAAVYAALYARFSSQWNYLASTYNLLMSTLAQAPLSEKTEECYRAWKAAIVEDAEDLHLATKPMFAPLLLEFLSDPNICDVFIGKTAGGETRLNALLASLERATGRTALLPSDSKPGSPR